MLPPSSPAPRLPLLALRSKVVFPRAVDTAEVSRSENLGALAAYQGEDDLFLAAPINGPEGGIERDKVGPVGTISRVMDRIHLPTGSQRVVLQGLWRARLDDVRLEGSHYTARVLESTPSLEAGVDLAPRVEETLALVRALALVDSSLATDVPDVLALNAEDPSRLTDLAANLFQFGYPERARLLMEEDVGRRLKLLGDLLRAKLVRAEVGRGLESKVHENIRKGFLREQLRAIRAELGDADPHELEVRDYEDRIAIAELPPAAARRALREVAILRRTAPSSREAATVRNYLDWMLELPWAADPTPAEPLDFERVARALDKSHTGLRDVKQRVIEHLAVHRLGGRASTVLCFAGPPGTGKSSMGKAVASALGRAFVQVPVGAIDEEAELRGVPYRQEGAGPGLILAGVHRAGSRAPVFLLDEVDKLQLGPSGTAGGALLEILDPDQNGEFLDHYLGLPFDLSRCVFLATATDVESIPEGILDRMEIIEFAGYTELEKLAIARDHLLPRAREVAGVTPAQFRLTPATLVAALRSYTEEAGVRQLQRVLNSLARKAAVDVVRGGDGLQLRKADLPGILGVPLVEEDLQVKRSAIGVANGLAWTSAGGALLPVEAVGIKGSGRTILTGQLGDVLCESVQTAISFVRTQFSSMGVPSDVLDVLDVHLHFPSGATPKDGPSAGIAIAVALVSLLNRVPVRHDVAMTGELSLHGNVLPVGGMRDKLLAAIRAGIREVIVPARNGEEVLRLPAEIRQKLTVHPISHVKEAFDLALARPLGSAVDGQASGGRGRRRAVRRSSRPRKTGRSGRRGR